MEPVNNEIVTSVKMRMLAEIVRCDSMIRGVLHSQYLETPYEFTSLYKMIEKMEEIFDAKKFPGAYMSPRSFGVTKGGAKKSEVETKEVMKESEKSVVISEAHGSKCTFEIMVRYRQNATWQGQIHWLEKNLQQSFRSVLEMLKLMDEALTEGEVDAGSVAWEGGIQPEDTK